MPEPRAAYIHVPFCAHRCGYCDFTVVAHKDQLIEPYLQALAYELRTLREPRPVDTLFIGGGTPTQLSPAQLRRLTSLVLSWLQPSTGAEFTVEANPSRFDDDKIDALRDAGANRISLGVQSFDRAVLEVLERDHLAEDVDDCVARLKTRFANVSLDLIFGVPGQSLPVWMETLKRAIELEPQHISTYGLTYERGTAFWGRRLRGTLRPVDEGLERDMYAAVMDELTAAGFEQYEISNFARPGFRCRHNEVYWKGLPYYGIGPGAARYVHGRRETNHRSVTTWLQRTLAGQPAIGDAEELSDEARARETLVLGLRRTDGINRHVFRASTGFDLDRLAGAAVRKYCRNGLLEDSGVNIRLTREGRFLADTVIVDFL